MFVRLPCEMPVFPLNEDSTPPPNPPAPPPPAANAPLEANAVDPPPA